MTPVNRHGDLLLQSLIFAAALLSVIVTLLLVELSRRQPTDISNFDTSFDRDL